MERRPRDAASPSAPAFDVADPALASDFTGLRGDVDFATYLRDAVAPHHSLALHAGGGTSGGEPGGRGPFYVGGFVDLPGRRRRAATRSSRAASRSAGTRSVAEAGNYYALVQRRVPLPDRQRRPRALDAADLPQPHHRQRVRRLRQRVQRRRAAREFKTGVGGRALVRHDARLRPRVHVPRRLRARARRAAASTRSYFVAGRPLLSREVGPTGAGREIGPGMRTVMSRPRRWRSRPCSRPARAARCRARRGGAAARRRSFNLDARFGRERDACSTRSLPTAREEFAMHHRAWGRAVRVADVELTGMKVARRHGRGRRRPRVLVPPASSRSCGARRSSRSWHAKVDALAARRPRSGSTGTSACWARPVDDRDAPTAPSAVAVPDRSASAAASRQA